MSDQDKPGHPAGATKPRAIPVDPVATPSPRVPRAFDLAGEAARPMRGRAKVEIEDSAEIEVDAAAAAAEPQRRATGLFSLASLFWTALTLLATLYLADAAWGLVASLTAKSPWVGQVALGLVGIVAAGLAAFLGRELVALIRMRRVSRLRASGAALIVEPGKEAVRDFVARLRDFYARDPTAAGGRAEITRALGELHDPRTLLAIAERALLRDKDDAARNAIAAAAQRVSVVTALSPRAIVDVLFVLVQSVALIRRLSAIYGGRASGFGLLRLTARVISHLAITGGMAVADSFLSQVLGAGLAARLSARLGEGVLNGILTARVGIAAIDLCRPFPYLECEPIALSQVVKNTILQDKVAENPAA